MGALKTTLKVIGYPTPPPDHAALRPTMGRGDEAHRKKFQKIRKTRNGKTDRVGHAAVAKVRATEGGFSRHRPPPSAACIRHSEVTATP
jgi:hypothetical protein